MTADLSREPLFVTNPRGKVHIRACPHLYADSKLTEATREQVDQNGLCSHCEKEVAGVGRQYFDTIEAAFEAFGHRSDEAKRLIRDALQGVTWELVWIPSSGSYIALAGDGQVAAWIGKGYVEVKGSPFVELPWFKAHGGGGGMSRDEARGGTCEVHFVERSVSGVCELCDD